MKEQMAERADSAAKTKRILIRTGLAVFIYIWLASSMGAGNEYLALANFGVWLLWAPTLIAAKLRWPSIPWTSLWMAAAGGGWMLLNLAVCAGPPPDSPFGAAFVWFTGWIYLLPLFGIAAGIYRSGSKETRWSHVGRHAHRLLPTLLSSSGLMVAIALSLWTPKAEAEASAIRIANDRNLGEVTGFQTQRIWRGWVVTLDLAGKPAYPIFFSRGGRQMGWSEG